MTSHQVKIAALNYARRGWAVFPCHPRGKAPLGARVPHGLKDATTDPETIRAWWDQEPEANIGLRTGEKFDVLDIDGPDDGTTELARLVAANGDIALEGPTVETPSGYHLLVSPTGVGNRARWIDRCDWRGRNGYVIGPPSVGANGKPYVWLEDGPDTPIRPAPEWLIDTLTRRIGEARTPITPNCGETVYHHGAYGLAALQDEVARVSSAPVGTRNDELNRASFAVGQLVGAGALDAVQVADSLLGAAMQAGLGHSEAVATIRSGLRAGAQTPRCLP